MTRKVTVIVWLLAAVAAHAAITDDLVMYMPYDEGQGVVTHDMSGNGYDGQLFYLNNYSGYGRQPTGNDHWVPGKWGSAVKMYNDGDHKLMDTHLTTPNGYAGTQDWSMSFWIKRPGRHIGWGSSWVNMWTLNEAPFPGGPANYTPGDEASVDWLNWGDLQYDLLHTRYDEWASAPNTGRNLNIGLSAGGAWEKHNVGSFLDGPDGDGWGEDVWHNVIITIDGNPAGGETQRFTTTVYVDGLPVQLISESGWGWGDITMEALTFGVGEPLKGIDVNDQLDDLGVWNRLLTTDEIAYLQANPAPEPASVLLVGLGGLVLARRRRR